MERLFLNLVENYIKYRLCKIGKNCFHGFAVYIKSRISKTKQSANIAN